MARSCSRVSSFRRFLKRVGSLGPNPTFILVGEDHASTPWLLRDRNLLLDLTVQKGIPVFSESGVEGQVLPLHYGTNKSLWVWGLEAPFLKEAGGFLYPLYDLVNPTLWALRVERALQSQDEGALNWLYRVFLAPLGLGGHHPCVARALAHWATPHGAQNLANITFRKAQEWTLSPAVIGELSLLGLTSVCGLFSKTGQKAFEAGAVAYKHSLAQKLGALDKARELAMAQTLSRGGPFVPASPTLALVGRAHVGALLSLLRVQGQGPLPPLLAHSTGPT